MAAEQHDVTENQNNEYEVERILGCKTINGVIHYKIRWKGFPPSHDTYEPSENLLGCQDIVNDFNKRRNARARSRGSWHYADPDELKPKDTFWKDIEAGRVDVLASDKLTRIKQRRVHADSRNTSECESLSSIDYSSTASASASAGGKVDDTDQPRPRRRGRPATKHRSALADPPPDKHSDQLERSSKPREAAFPAASAAPSATSSSAANATKPATGGDFVKRDREKPQRSAKDLRPIARARNEKASASTNEKAASTTRDTQLNSDSRKPEESERKGASGASPSRISLLVPTGHLVVPHPPLTPPTPAIAGLARRTGDRASTSRTDPDMSDEKLEPQLSIVEESVTNTSAPPTPNVLLSPAGNADSAEANDVATSSCSKRRRCEPLSNTSSDVEGMMFPILTSTRAAAATALTKSRMLLGLYTRAYRGRRHAPASTTVPTNANSDVQVEVPDAACSKRTSRKPRGAGRQHSGRPRKKILAQQSTSSSQPDDSEQPATPAEVVTATSSADVSRETADTDGATPQTEHEPPSMPLGIALLRLSKQAQLNAKQLEGENALSDGVTSAATNGQPAAASERDLLLQHISAARQRMAATSLSREWNLAPIVDTLALATFLDLPTASGIPQYVRAQVESALAQSSRIAALNALLQTAVQRKDHLAALHVLRVAAALYSAAGDAREAPWEQERGGERHVLDCEQRDERLGYSLLMQAVRAGANELVDVLLRFGADANASTRDASALMLASEMGNVVGCAALLANGAMLDARSPRDGETALHRAVCRGQRRVVEYLLARGADWTVQRTADGHTCAQIADDLHLVDTAQHVRKHAARVAGELRDATLRLLAIDNDDSRFTMREEPVCGVYLVDFVELISSSNWDLTHRYKFTFDFQLPSEFLTTLSFGYIVCIGVLTSSCAGGELHITTGAPRNAPIRSVRVNQVRQPTLVPSRYVYACSPLLNGANELTVDCSKYSAEHYPFALCASAKLLIAIFRVDTLDTTRR